MYKKVEIKSKYEASANVYDSRYEQIQLQKYAQMLDGFVIDKLPVLDLGCGTGLLAKHALAKPKLQVSQGETVKINKKIFGCDISFEMLKIAKSRGEIIVQADQEHLPFRANSFGTIFSFTSLQNSEKPELMLKEAKRVLKTRRVNDSAASESKDSREDSVFILTYLKKFDFTKEIGKLFEIQEVKDLGEDEGFVLL